MGLHGSFTIGGACLSPQYGHEIMSFVVIKDLNKSFGANQVVRDVSLNIERGEFISLLGPSGCGKTTVLRMVAGFELPSSGQIKVDGQDMTHLSPAKRGVGMVFQSYALFPNMNVADNVGFGLKVAGKPQNEIKSRVAEMLDLIKLPHLAGRYPYQMSGGQQQRVSLARALAVSPRILLLDEPLSALDAKIRVSLRDEIRALQKKLGITTIFVTHDQEEALSMSDRVVVMNEGQIEQNGTPFEIYSHPSTNFVAGFVGTLTKFDAEIIDAKSGKLKLADQIISAGQSLNGMSGQKITLAIRPEAIALGHGGKTANQLHVEVEDLKFMGSILRVNTKLGLQSLMFDMFNQSGQQPPKIGEMITVNFAPQDLVLLET
jgi:putative spermidine/putrescine transport system ATP-binding protein